MTKWETRQTFGNRNGRQAVYEQVVVKNGSPWCSFPLPTARVRRDTKTIRGQRWWIFLFDLILGNKPMGRCWEVRDRIVVVTGETPCLLFPKERRDGWKRRLSAPCERKGGKEQKKARGALKLKLPPDRKNPQAGVIHLLGKILREDHKFSFCLQLWVSQPLRNGTGAG